MLLHKNKKALLALLVVYWLLFNYFVIHAPIEVFGVDDHQAISAMQVSSDRLHIDELELEGVDGPSPETRSLPDDWYHSGYPEREQWYFTQLELTPSDAQVWAVYLSSVTHNAAVYINDVWIGQGGAFADPVSRHHNNPLFFEFSADLLAPEGNRLAIKVKASHPRQGLLGDVYVAPADTLREAYAWKRYWRVDFIQWITMAMYVMGAIVFCFWLARRQDKIYGLFALQLFIWATHNLNLFVFNIPTSAHFWEAMTMSTLGWTVVAMIFFNHRYVGDGIPWIERSALIFGVLGLGIFFLPDIGLILTLGYGIWDSFLIVFGSYAIIHLMKVFWRRAELDVYLMLIVGIPILVFGFHDILTVNHLRDRTEGLTIQYSVIPAIMLFSWFLIRRFVQSINQAELMTATLEQRVAQKQEELQEQYEQLKSLEKQSLLSEERERIMRDMHDGIGGQLVSVATLLQEQQLKQGSDHDNSLSFSTDGDAKKVAEVLAKVREKVLLSLNDLRFVIDSLDPVLNDLPTLLGMMRSRLSDQLLSAGVELDWAVTDLPELGEMSPRRSLHIMRILQEVFTNAIKHAQTQHMRLSTRVLETDRGQVVEICIQDFGCGLPPDVLAQVNHDLHQRPDKKSGRGIANMRYRAQQIGAVLKLESDDQGTCIRLLLPV